MNVLSDLLINTLNTFVTALELTIYLLFFWVNLKAKVKWQKFFLLYGALINVIYFVVRRFGLNTVTFQDVFNVQMNFPIWTFFCFLIFFIIVYISFSDKLLKKLLMIALQFLLTVLVDTISSIIFVQITGSSVDNVRKYPLQELLCHSLFIMLIVLILLSVSVVLNKKAQYLKSGNIGFILLVYATQFALFVMLIYTKANHYTASFIVFIVIMDFLCMCIDILLIVHMNRIGRLATQKEQLATALEIQKAENKYNKSIIDNNEAMAKIRHDYIDQMQVVKLLVESDDKSSRLKAIHILEKLSAAVHRTSTEQYCENKTINALLTAKIQDFEKNNIKYDIKCLIPSNTFIDDLALCSVFSNLINNGIEAAQKCSQPYVDIYAKGDDDKILINIKNSVDENITVVPIKIKARFTTKEDKNNHGFGVSIVKNIVEKYNGVISADCKDGCYEVTILFQADNSLAS